MSKSEQTDEEESNSSYVGGDDELAMCEDLFTAVMSATDNDGRLLSAAFQLLPSKKVIVFFFYKLNVLHIYHCLNKLKIINDKIKCFDMN